MEMEHELLSLCCRAASNEHIDGMCNEMVTFECNDCIESMCGDCGEIKVDSVRTEGGMKCGACVYGG